MLHLKHCPLSRSLKSFVFSTNVCFIEPRAEALYGHKNAQFRVGTPSKKRRISQKTTTHQPKRNLMHAFDLSRAQDPFKKNPAGTHSPQRTVSSQKSSM